MNEIHHPPPIAEAFDWRATIRQWRENHGITQADLARRSGLSLASIKAYERGQRNPSRATLESLISALGIPREAANHILAGAGYAIDWQALFHERYLPLTVEQLQQEAEEYAWPAFVTNQSFDVVALNAATGIVFDVDTDTQLTGFGERNLLGGITHDGFADRLENWDEVVRFICGLAKGDTRWGTADPSRPAPWLERPIERFLQGNPARIRRFFEIWESSEPIPHRIRQRFRIEWWHRDGTLLTFAGRLVIADIWSELHWNEWIPANARTWRILSRETAQP